MRSKKLSPIITKKERALETVAGIDCGLKNLAIVIAIRDKDTKVLTSIQFWDVIDIASAKLKITKKQTKAAAKTIKDKDLFDTLMTLLNSTDGTLAAHLSQCCQITIEKQMTQTMNRVAYMLYTMLSIEYPVASVAFASGIKKNNYLKKLPHVIEWLKTLKDPTPKKKEAKYRINKQMSVVHLKFFVQTMNMDDDIVISRLKEMKMKIDDLGDALCYCYI